LPTHLLYQCSVSVTIVNVFSHPVPCPPNCAGTQHWTAGGRGSDWVRLRHCRTSGGRAETMAQSFPSQHVVSTLQRWKQRAGLAPCSAGGTVLLSHAPPSVSVSSRAYGSCMHTQYNISLHATNR